MVRDYAEREAPSPFAPTMCCMLLCMRSLIFLTFVSLTLSACVSSPKHQPSSDVTMRMIPAEISRSALASANYTLIDPTVRHALTEARQDFTISLRHGTYNFPPSALVGHYQTVTADTENIIYGDLNADGVQDAVIQVRIGTDEFSMTELAAFTASGGTATQFAAFPLGHATVKNIAIVDGKIRVNITHVVPGDPGPRNTEYILQAQKNGQ